MLKLQSCNSLNCKLLFSRSNGFSCSSHKLHVYEWRGRLQRCSLGMASMEFSSVFLYTSLLCCIILICLREHFPHARGIIANVCLLKRCTIFPFTLTWFPYKQQNHTNIGLQVLCLWLSSYFILKITKICSLKKIRMISQRVVPIACNGIIGVILKCQ